MLTDRHCLDQGFSTRVPRNPEVPPIFSWVSQKGMNSAILAIFVPSNDKSFLKGSETWKRLKNTGLDHVKIDRSKIV